MDFHVVANSYNCYGGHTTLSPIGDFLLAGSGNFGGAIQEIAVTLHFRDSGPAKKTLESLLETHNNFRATLPKVTYRRAKGKVEIAIASELMEGRDWTHSSILSLPLFKAGVDEVIHALGLLSKRLKRTDDFSLEKFLDHCEAARKRVPDSEEALQFLASGLKAAAQAKRDGMSAWEQLGIDWEDFHPKAREMLDDPFFGTARTISRRTAMILAPIFWRAIASGTRRTRMSRQFDSSRNWQSSGDTPTYTPWTMMCAAKRRLLSHLRR